MIVCTKCLRTTDELLPAATVTSDPCSRCGQAYSYDPTLDRLDFVRIDAHEPDPSGTNSEENRP